MSSNKLVPFALGIGAVAGLRSFTAPAAVGFVSSAKTLLFPNPALRFLRSPATRNISIALALGELVADKLPSTPNRTDAGPLAARIVSGALCGAALYGSARRSLAAGAFWGGVGAVGGAFAGYEIRRRLGATLAVPDAAIAAVEDAIAVSSGLALAGRS